MYICVRNIRVSLIAYVVCAEMRSTCFFFCVVLGIFVIHVTCCICCMRYMWLMCRARLYVLSVLYELYLFYVLYQVYVF